MISVTQPAKRGRGRPKGSRNKKKPDGYFATTGKPRPAVKHAPGIVINGNRVAWSFIKLIYRRLHCDWDDTIDAFWKARHCTGSNGIQRYIMSGFKPDKTTGKPWILNPSNERENGKMESIRQWWLKLYTPSERLNKRGHAFHTPEIKQMLETLIDGMSI